MNPPLSLSLQGNSETPILARTDICAGDVIETTRAISISISADSRYHDLFHASIPIPSGRNPGYSEARVFPFGYISLYGRGDDGEANCDLEISPDCQPWRYRIISRARCPISPGTPIRIPLSTSAEHITSLTRSRIVQTLSQISECVCIQSSPRGGWGVFATESITSGRVVETTPWIQAPMRDEPLTSYGFSHFGGCIGLGYSSLYNHSFDPNLDYDILASGVIQFTSNRRIRAGSELTINYGQCYWMSRGCNPQ